MYNILLLRDPLSGDRYEPLLVQQAILAVVRSALAGREIEGRGMRLSDHRILVPAYIDILPLLALIADDYTEFTEPESGKERRETPFIVYWDDPSLAFSRESLSGTRRQQDGSGGGPEPIDLSEKELLALYLDPKWFAGFSEEDTVSRVVHEYKPEICVIIGNGRRTGAVLRRLDHRFRKVIGFSVFMNDEDKMNLSRNDYESLLADKIFEDRKKQMRAGPPPDGQRESSYGSGEFRKDEKEPEIEPFIAFGPAFEYALYMY